jgi:uncharacterized protein
MPSNYRKYPFFAHLFESQGIFYHYETSTQEIIALEPVMAVVLSCYADCQKGNVPDRVSSQFRREEIQEALWTIEQAAYTDGFFCRHRPHLVSGTRQENKPENLQHLILTLTENCNLRCRYCLHGASLDWVRPHGNQSMTLETALNATRYFLERCCTEDIPAVSFYGGEALLQADLIQAVVAEVRNHPHGINAHLVIDTNAVLLDEATIDMVVQNKMYLQVSLDGPREYHDRQRPDTRGAGTYEPIMKALDRLLSLDAMAHERLSFICTVAPPVSLMELDQFFGELPIFARHGIKTNPNLRVNLANLNGQDWPATPEEFKELADQLLDIREYYFKEVAAGRRGSLGPVVKGLMEPGLFRLHHRSKAPIGETYTPGGNCKPGIRKLHVTVDGRLQPCERTGDSLEIGQLPGGIDSAAVVNLKEDFFNAVQNNCNDCWALRLCGVCYAGWAEYAGGQKKGSRLPQSVCNSVRHAVEQDLKLLVRILELPAGCRQYLDEVLIG